MKDIRQSVKYAKYMALNGWGVEKKNGVYFYIKRLPVVGSFVKVQRPGKINFEDIEYISKKYRALQIVIEPKIEIKADGFKLSKSPYLPSKTIELDLGKSQKKIIESFSKDARYGLRKARNSNVEILKSHQVSKFRNNWKRAVNVRRYVMSEQNLINMQKAFGDDMMMLMTESGNAGALFLVSGKMAYYWQAFTNKEGRKNLEQYRVVFEGIKWAKRKGARRFDFEGVFDERFPRKNWQGFSMFKKKCGGEEKVYPGAYSKWRFPK